MSPSLPDGLVSAAVSLAVVLAAAVALRLAWGRLLAGGRGGSRWQKWLAESTATPVFLLVVAAGAQGILARLAPLPPLRDLPLTPYLTGAAYCFTVLSVTWVAYGALRGLTAWYFANVAPTAHAGLDLAVIPAVRRAIKLLLIFVAATVVLEHYNVKLTALLGAAGVASLAVALAAQETIANMIAGFTIILDRPFRLGDRLELSDGRIGDVHEIGLRTTRILSFDHTLYIIPNAELAKSSVTNHSYPDGRIKVRQTLSVAYGNDPGAVKRILVESCRAHRQVLADPPPEALVTQLGDAALQLGFHFWIADYRMRQQVVDEINTVICSRLEKEGIRRPLPREVRLV